MPSVDRKAERRAEKITSLAGNHYLLHRDSLVNRQFPEIQAARVVPELPTVPIRHWLLVVRVVRVDQGIQMDQAHHALPGGPSLL